MPLETANYIYDLVQSNPPDTDLVQQGDDHLRLLKKVIQQTWPNITGPNLPTSTGSANAQVVTHVYGPAAYSAGQMVTFKAGFTNTGPTTINVNGAGPVTIGKAGAALVAGDLVAGSIYTAIYDPASTAFMLIAGSGAFLPLTGGTLTGLLRIAPSGANVAEIDLVGGAGQPAQVLMQASGQHQYYLIASTDGNFYIYDATVPASRLGVAPTTGIVSVYSGLSVGGNGISYAGSNYIAFAASNTGGLCSNLLLSFDGVATCQVMTTANISGYTAVPNIGIAGASSAMYAWYGTGTNEVYWTITFSDRRLKTKIVDAGKDALAAIAALKVHEFDLTPPFEDAITQHWNWGLIADEVGDLIPSARVQPHGESYESLRELPLIGALVKAVQQLTARVEVLETKLADLGA